MTQEHPQRKPNIISEVLGEEVVLCDPEADVVHVLNPTARVIWELCDGVHSPAEMAAALQEKFAVAPERDLAEDVEQTLAELEGKGLLVEG